MTKSTPVLFLNHLQKHSCHLFFSKLFYPGSHHPPPPSGAMLPHIIWLALGFLPSYAPGYRFTKIRKSYEFVTPIVLHRLNEFVERKPFVRTFVKRAPVLPGRVDHGQISVLVISIYGIYLHIYGI